MLLNDLSIKYVNKVKRNLLRQGFWGFSVQKLLDELRDHFVVKFEQLKSEGHSPDEAQKMTEKALGEPQAIASEWANALQSRSWISRNPGASAVLVFVSVWCFDYLMMVIFSPHLSAFDLSAGVLAINWLAWAVGLAFLFWKAIRAPVGWGPLLWWCWSLGLAASAWEFSGTISPKTGNPLFWLEGSTWSSLWAYPLCWFLHVLHSSGFDRPGFWAGVWLGPNLFKLMFPPLACWATRWYCSEANKLRGTSTLTRE